MSQGVLLIRPHEQVNSFEQALGQNGYDVYCQAVIETHPVVLADSEWGKLNNAYDAVVVISPTSAQYFDTQLRARELAWPKSQYYCVGSGTADHLVPLSRQAVTYPAPAHTSEALLQLNSLQHVGGQRWLIITGQQGRSLIAQTLTERGATVDTLEVYKRQPINPELASHYEKWRKSVDLIVVSSQQQLELFLNALKPVANSEEWAFSRDWVVSSPRLAEKLGQAGVSSERIHIAENATQAALLRTIGKVKPAKSKNETIVTKTPASTQPNEEAVKVKTTPKRSAFATFFMLILLLCVLALGAGGYWVWTQQQALRAETNAQISELNQRIEAANASQEALADDALSAMETELNSRLHAFQQERQAQAQEERQQNEQARQAMRDEFEQHSTDLEQIRTEINAANLRVSEDLFLVEARDLTIAAGRKLWLDFDRRTAIELLERSEQILADAQQTHLMPIRQQLRNDIELLEGVEDPDLESLAMRVNAVRRQLRSLPLHAQRTISEREQDEDISADFSDWRSNLAKAWSNFTDDFIRIQRTEEMPELYLGQEQQALLLSQLELQLQIAQQALLQRQTINYREAIKQAVEWIEAYFETDKNAVQRTINELNQLQAVDLDPAYPTRLLSEAMLRDAVDELLQGAN